MQISYNWLTQYVDPEWDPDTLAEELTLAGLEVETVTARGQDLDALVVGEIQAVREHPNADRLVLCDVDLGDGDPVQIACGAPNVEAGQKVPVAPVGTTLSLPDGDDPDARTTVDIEARSIRGEDSHGMICAEDELGLTDDHSGIMVLGDDATVGQSLPDYLSAHDVTAADAILDIELTPNRSDAASHIGVARDVAALTDTPLRRPFVETPEAGGKAAEEITVQLDDASGCPRYVGMVVRDIEVRPSPLWLRQRLSAIGLEPRNHVVDVTNFVLHECGQPLHAFDRDHIADDTIIVRRADGETDFTTLDDEERTLPDDTLLICDPEKPVAVAGVMGGANSEVTRDTTDVIIESAYFDPSTIRKTAKALDVQTDSSYRFERGVDRDGQAWAAARAARLIADLGDGTVVPGMVDEHPNPPTPETVTLRPERLQQVLGMDVPTDEVINLLSSIGFDVKIRLEKLELNQDITEDQKKFLIDVISSLNVKRQKHDPTLLDYEKEHLSNQIGANPDEIEECDVKLDCTVPTWRPDVSIEEDLIEEVARLHGYDQIPEPERVPVPSHAPTERPTDALEDQARALLRGQGYREIYTNSMLSAERAEWYNVPIAGGKKTSIVKTKNPISEEMAALRPRLLPGALEVAQHNRNHGQDALRFFEFGHVYRRATDDEEPIVPGYTEYPALLLALSGRHAPIGWDTERRDTDIFDLKGIVENILDDLGLLADTSFTPIDDLSGGIPEKNYRLLSKCIKVNIGNKNVGIIGQVGDDTRAAEHLHYQHEVFNLSLLQEHEKDYITKVPDVFAAEFDWSRIVEQAALQHHTYEPVSRHPVVDRDLAVLAPADQPVGPMQDTIRATGAPLLRRVNVFDVYEGEGIPDDAKSVAFTLRFGADRTLTDEEVDDQIEAVMEALNREHDATLRQ